MAKKLAALLICDATATAPDGKFTVYGIFDVIFCQKVPARYPLFSIYWKIYSDKGGDICLRIEKPDGSTLIETNPTKIDVSDSGTAQGVFTFGGVEFPEAGDYRILLSLDKVQEIGSSTLTIQERLPSR
jgi:hypothetical protein